MFVFIGGVQPRTIRLSNPPEVCQRCGAVSVITKRTDQYLSLFFIPLIRIKKGQHYVECDRCGGDPCILKCRGCGSSIQLEFSFCPYCGVKK